MYHPTVKRTQCWKWNWPNYALQCCRALFVFGFLNLSVANAQDDLMNELNESMPKERDFVYATFKGTRLINLHTVETLGKGTLEFRIAHRFGDFSSGANNFWGLDGPATIQFHFDYGVSDRLTLGIGRAAFNKVYDAFAKYNIARQTRDSSMPVTVTLLGSVNVVSDVDRNRATTGVDQYRDFGNRIVYMAQAFIARKINAKLSFQLSPTFLHYNLAYNFGDQNDIFALGLSGRYKISSHAALTGEYIHRINNYTINSGFYSDALSLGFDLETGGHVFQVFLTNSSSINETAVIPYTESKWSKGQIRLGFNISRVFGVHKSEKS